MNNFELYEKLLKKTDISKPNTTDCSHSKTVIENSITMCISCGIEIEYPSAEIDTKHISDTTRYYIRKSKEKSIYNDIQHLDVNDKIKDRANEIYMNLCGDKVHRGIHRKSIVFASVYHAFKLENDPQSFESLRKVFNANQITIKRKDALKGLKFINENAPSNSPLRTIYITPKHLIQEFMIKFNATKEQTEEVIEIYNSVKNKSNMLNRSRPQSVAAGIIYYYITTKGKHIPMKEFIAKVNLSELTINKINKEVGTILDKK